MSVGRAKKTSGKAQVVTVILDQRLEEDIDQALKSEQKANHLHPKYVQRQQAEIEATKEQRTMRAVEQALKKKGRTAEREAVARREAARRDLNLQRRLIDRYGYGRCHGTSTADTAEIIELSPLMETESKPDDSKVRQSGQPFTNVCKAASIEQQD